MKLNLEIDRLCDEFEQEWRSDIKPEIGRFLDRMTDVARLTLLRQLLPIDLEFRLARGEVPRVDDYGLLGADAQAIAAESILGFEASGRFPASRSGGESDRAERSDSRAARGTSAAGDCNQEAGPDESTRTDMDELQNRRYSPETRVPENRSCRRFGDYELLEEISRGGMGVVYKARQIRLNRVVALKMILTGSLASDEEVQRFRTEAESAAHLDHPGIVPIYEIGEHEGQQFFSMGYVDGCSLADQVKNGPMQPRDAAALTRQIAESIAYAHHRNVIHRDLKPGNVLLDRKGVPRVTDFGLARKLDSDSSVTRTGAILGTPSYMSPEQAAGKTSEVGPLSDVYALGALLYCLLTGRPPFQAATPVETLQQVIARDPVSVASINPQIPRDLDTICHKCLQKQPNQRYASAQRLVDDLGRWIRGEPIQARAISTSERLYRWIRRNKATSVLSTVTAVAIVAGVISSISFGLQATVEAENARLAESRSAVEAKRARNSAEAAITARNDAESSLFRSQFLLADARWKDGRIAESNHFLFSIPEARRGLEWQLSHNRLYRNHRLLHVHRSEVTAVRISPGKSLLLSGTASGELFAHSPEFGTVQLAREHQDAITCIAFHPDGGVFSSADQRGHVVIWDARLQTILTRFSSPQQTGNPQIVSAAFIPGETLLCIANASGWIWFADHAANRVSNCQHVSQHRINDMVVHPDGTSLFFGCDDHLAHQLKLPDLSPIREFKGHDFGVNAVALSPDGSTLATGGNDSKTLIWKVGSEEEPAVVQGQTAAIRAVRFSPDGKAVASAGDDAIVTIRHSDGERRIQTLCGHVSPVSTLDFSRDSAFVVTGCRDRTVRIWNLSGTDPEHVLQGHTAAVNSVAVSPDGKRIASASYDGRIRIWDSQSGECLNTLSEHSVNAHHVVFSPSGKLLASSDWHGRIVIRQAADFQVVCTINAHKSAANCVSFSADDRMIVSSSWDGRICAWDAGSGASKWENNTPGVQSNYVRFSPDRELIAAAGADYKVRLLDATDGHVVDCLEGHSLWVWAVDFSPDGDRLVSCSGDGTIICWNVAERKAAQRLTGHLNHVNNVCFSDCGKYLVSASSDKSVKVWDVEEAAELLSLEEHSDAVWGIDFSRTGNCAVSASWDGTVRIWRFGELPWRWLKGEMDKPSANEMSIAVGKDSWAVDTAKVNNPERQQTLLHAGF